MRFNINKTVIISIAAVFAVIIMIIVAVFSVQGSAITYEEKVQEAKSQINTQEKRRSDLIPNLVDCVKEYDKYEYQTLLDIVKARTNQDGVISEEAVKEIKENINVVLEKYPDLKSQDNYKLLMTELANTENKITNTRDAYNNAVSRYNIFVRNPINSFFLSLTGYEKVEYPRLNYDVSEDAPTNLFD